MHRAIWFRYWTFIILFTPLLAQETVLPVGQQAPPLSFTILNDPDQQVLSWHDVDEDVVIIDFWATWCGPCISSIPHLNALQAEFADSSVRFLSITYEPEEKIRPFVKKYPMQTTVGSDNDFAMFKAYNAWGIPMITIVNRKRQIAAVIHPSKLTGQVISEVLNNKIPPVEQAAPWPDPAGAEEYFRSLLD